MSFRTLLALILLSILGASVFVIYFAVNFLRDQVVGTLPEHFVFGVDTAFRDMLLAQGSILLAASVILLGTVFFVLGNLVAKPLRELSAVMNAYAATGERRELPSGGFIPKEIRSLRDSFAAFVDRVESAHQKDMDISRMKSDFISTAAHQLRTPMTGIRWALEALQQENLTAEQKALVESAVGKSKDLVAIVGTLLDISSIESGKYKYHFVPVDMSVLAAGVAKEFAPTASARGVSLFFVGNEGEDAPPARADLERIKWVVTNLVENAIRYTPSGGTVQISVAAVGGKVYVRVKDTGIGIPKADRANIFERFYRAGNAVQKENAGSGLGLYIARSVATDHGGDLGFEENQGGVGTTFTLSLPIA